MPEITRERDEKITTRVEIVEGEGDLARVVETKEVETRGLTEEEYEAIGSDLKTAPVMPGDITGDNQRPVDSFGTYVHAEDDGTSSEAVRLQQALADIHNDADADEAERRAKNAVKQAIIDRARTDDRDVDKQRNEQQRRVTAQPAERK